MILMQVHSDSAIASTVIFHVPFDSRPSILPITTSSDVAPIKFSSVASIEFILSDTYNDSIN